MAALQKDRADLVHQRRALAYELGADPVQGLHVELRSGLERHELGIGVEKGFIRTFDASGCLGR